MLIQSLMIAVGMLLNESGRQRFDRFIRDTVNPLSNPATPMESFENVSRMSFSQLSEMGFNRAY